MFIVLLSLPLGVLGISKAEAYTFSDLSSLTVAGSAEKKSLKESSKKTQNVLYKMASALEEKSQSFRQLNSQDGVFPEIHLHVENCQEYPYYGMGSNGPQNFKEDFIQLIRQSKQCLLQENQGRQLPTFVKTKVTELYQLLTAPRNKTVACTFGEYDSFYAVSNSGLNPNDHGPNGVFLDMPRAPSIFMDTNRIAGNFPLGIDSDDVKKIKRFYGDKLNGVEILPGKRNPMVGRIANSASLLFHEMLHWVELTHAQKDYPDLVYLSQICCFDHPSINREQRQMACEILYNDDYWSGSKDQRRNKLAEDSIPVKQKMLIQLYHQ